MSISRRLFLNVSSTCAERFWPMNEAIRKKWTQFGWVHLDKYHRKYLLLRHIAVAKRFHKGNKGILIGVTQTQVTQLIHD